MLIYKTKEVFKCIEIKFCSSFASLFHSNILLDWFLFFPADKHLLTELSSAVQEKETLQKKYDKFSRELTKENHMALLKHVCFFVIWSVDVNKDTKSRRI